jgi:urease accessory protein
MLVADSYLGHRSELSVEEPLLVTLSDTERRRSRVRTETADGREVGIVVGRELGDGDVLEADGGIRVVVELAAVEAVALDLGGLSPAAALELGHDFGNRHWDLAVREGEALLPVPDSRERMDDALDRLLPDGADWRHLSVPPTTFDGTPDHGHDHSHDGHHRGDGHDGDEHHGGGHGHGTAHSHEGHPPAYGDLRGESG